MVRRGRGEWLAALADGVGLAAFSQVDMLGVWYRSVNFGWQPCLAGSARDHYSQAEEEGNATVRVDKFQI